MVIITISLMMMFEYVLHVFYVDKMEPRLLLHNIRGSRCLLIWLIALVYRVSTFIAISLSNNINMQEVALKYVNGVHLN